MNNHEIKTWRKYLALPLVVTKVLHLRVSNAVALRQPGASVTEQDSKVA